MVFVLDKHKKPLMPCSEKRARQLLEKGRAVVHKMEPFTIRVKERIADESHLQPLRLKLDPGSKKTGLAITEESNPVCGKVIYIAEIHHKKGIKQNLDSRRALRRGRRNRKTRYRKARFLNRTRAKGWLPPSLTARVDQTINVVKKLGSLLPVIAISTEHVKFDTQLMQNAEISGIEYQQGTLAGYEIREYLLEKWGRKCVYCNTGNIPLEVEHIVPKARGGSNRISNLALSCRDCNQNKGTMTAEEFGFPEVQKNCKKPLKDTAMMNATRWALLKKLKETGLPVECGTGARTKMQRIQHNLPKQHYYDACCVGASTPNKLVITAQYIQYLISTGRGKRQICQTDKYGFPVRYRQRQKIKYGFQTGDIAKVVIPKGKRQGCYRGRVIAKANGRFDLQTHEGFVFGIGYKYFCLIQRTYGWRYEKKLYVPSL